MIRLGKHESTDDPPDKPFWRGRKRQQDACHRRRKGLPFLLRRKCSELLTKWHNLSECGVVSHEEYEELKKKILEDIKRN